MLKYTPGIRFTHLKS